VRVRGGEPVPVRDLERAFNKDSTPGNLEPLQRARQINLAVMFARRPPRKKGRYRRRA